MTPRFHEVLDMAIEQGVASGINRYYKHRDDPRPADEEALREAVVMGLKSALHEWFYLPEEV